MYIWGVLYSLGIAALVITGAVLVIRNFKAQMAKRRILHYAYHEAGHVLLFLVLGCRFQKAEIAEAGDGSHGQVTPYDNSFSGFNHIANENIIKIAYAGVIASSLRYRGNHSHDGYSDNLIIKRTLESTNVPLNHSSMDDYLRFLRRSVRESLTINSDALDRIALFLAERKAVTEEEILQHLKTANIAVVS